MPLTYPQVPVKERRSHVGSLEDVPDLFLHGSEALQHVLGVGVPLHQSGAAVRLVLRVPSFDYCNQSKITASSSPCSLPLSLSLSLSLRVIGKRVYVKHVEHVEHANMTYSTHRPVRPQHKKNADETTVCSKNSRTRSQKGQQHRSSMRHLTSSLSRRQYGREVTRVSITFAPPPERHCRVR